MTDFAIPTDQVSARRFLASLANAGLMYHPEDNAADCLGHLSLANSDIAAIQTAMDTCFELLDDPCAVALEELDRIRRD
ncbi:hypothetical protein [Roseibium alexandrii]|uniref:hypothetical protein n=1 Tax=Roseibium alexandrii TaxID=388408 RepID=UPI0037513900